MVRGWMMGGLINTDGDGEINAAAAATNTPRTGS